MFKKETVIAVIVTIIVSAAIGALVSKREYNDGKIDGRVEGRAEVELGVIALAKQQWDKCGELRVNDGETLMIFTPAPGNCETELEETEPEKVE